MAIEPIFETLGFREGSYGFRPGPGCKDALREVDRLLKEGYTHAVDADLKELFRHDPVRQADGAGGREDQRWTRLDLIEGYLGQGIMKGMER